MKIPERFRNVILERAFIHIRVMILVLSGEWRFSPVEGSLSWAESLPGLGRACDCWAALSLERRPSGGRPHSCPPSASSCFESTERERESEREPQTIRSL